MSELIVRIRLGEDDAEVRVGSLLVPEDAAVTDVDFRRALSIVLREAADRIDPDLPPAPPRIPDWVYG